MSVAIIKERYDFMGKLVVQSHSDTLTSEDIKNRVEALAYAIARMDTDTADMSVISVLVEMLEEYLPTEEQWKKIFEH
ncbi:MAG TPA: hypothetical protein PLP27_11000 [Crocinitomicaceae bacterium]|nr:hypothetical protein [Crocinitomicaceae bacterium]